MLNNQIREAAHEYLLLKNNEKKETLKRLIKDSYDRLHPMLFTAPKDGSGLKFGEFSLLHAMYYSYLEPIKVMTNNDVKALLPKFRDAHNLLTWD